MTARLSVYLNATRVGSLLLEFGDRTSFVFDNSYLRLPDRPVLSRYYEDLLSPQFCEYAAHSRLPPFFQNLLPEEGALRTLLARRAGVPAHREYALLAALGNDLAGAVVVRLEEDDAPESDEAVPAAESTTSNLAEGALRFSLAGLQLKFSVLRSGKALTVPVTGSGGRWILKLPDERYHSLPACEFSVMQWARTCGIVVPQVELVSWREVAGLPDELGLSETAALLVQRFDRSESGVRIHQEDFAQVLGLDPDRKYDGATYATIANIIVRVAGEADLEQFIRRLVFMIVCGNADMHVKNIALMYPDARRPRLTPAYDLVSTMAFRKTSRELALRLSGERDPYQITSTHFGRLTDRIGQSFSWGRDLAEAAAKEARTAFVAQGPGLPWDTSVRRFLEEHLTRLKL